MAKVSHDTSSNIQNICIGYQTLTKVHFFELETNIFSNSRCQLHLICSTMLITLTFSMTQTQLP